ncbi:MAG: chaperone NapD [Woeseiaceae bacterium]
MAEAEYHVASFVVHANPKIADGLTNELTAIDGIEVHAEREGKLVVTAEAENVRRLAELSDEIQTLPGVIAVAPVYHEFTGGEQ